MNRACLLAVLVLGLAAAAPAQSPPGVPTITLNASGTGGGSGGGSAKASGTITIPAGWELSVHVVTVRYQKQGGTKTLNALMPVKGANFEATIGLEKGSYSVWAVIDVKDAAGHERQISSQSSSVSIP